VAATALPASMEWIVNLRARYRLAIAVLAGVLASIAPGTGGSAALRFLIPWDVGAATYLVLAWIVIAHADARVTRRRARSQDVGAYVILVLVLTAAFASTAAITFLMQGVKELALWPKAVHLTLSVIALISSWLLIHTLYSFHYARRFYASRSDPDAEARGLNFPGRDNPDYFDFAYYSFVVGMTSQVSDVSINSHHMRRLTLVHGILSFVFNIAIFALSVNIIVTVI